MSVIEKQCKYCGAHFQIVHEIKGKGSSAKLRRLYCSLECQISQRKQRNRIFLPTRMTKLCVECGNEFYVPESLKTRLLCSNACRYVHTAKLMTKHSVHALKCMHCKDEFHSKNEKRKFCSLKCYYAAQCNRHTSKCEVCDALILSKKSYQPRFCGKRCTYIAQSRGLIATHINGRSRYRTDIVNSPYFKSSFEADYYRYCLYVNMTPSYEQKTFHVTVDGVEKHYTPDFWVKDNHYIELKGVREGTSRFSKLLNSNSRVREAVVSLGYQIDVLYMSDFYLMLREQQLYDVIPNLEHKDYASTKHLIVKHGQHSRN